MERKRPKGVTMLGILCVIYSLLLSWLVYVAISVVTPYEASLTLSSKIKVTIILGGVLGILVGGIGILTFLSWARKLITIVAIINLPFWFFCLIEAVIEAVDYFVYDRSFGPSFPYNLIIIPLLSFNLFCVYFLTRPEVKEQFRKEE
ncbi:MAG: hypothetical protein ISS45_05335 [Candidatus Omnitrophica bacterium]|nr:hypothetical protein [Candidatus Omnitrophota bacterium]